MKTILLLALLVCTLSSVFAQSRWRKRIQPDTLFATALERPSLGGNAQYAIPMRYKPARYHQTPTDRQVDSVYRERFKMDEVPAYWENTKTHRERPGN